MKVKIKEFIYDSEEEPIVILLSEQDKKNISNMGDAIKYCSFPDSMDEEDVKAFMNWGNKELE